MHLPFRPIILGRGLTALLLIVAACATFVGCRTESDAEPAQPAQDAHTDEHAEGHSEAASIELSTQALKNIGYTPHKVAVSDYQRTVTLPGMIIERPGKSQIRVSTPLAGVIARSHVNQGEAVKEGAPLFEIRLAHEEVGASQGEFLESLQALDTVDAELKRLKSITEGVIAGRRILEQQYERQKIEARMQAQRQGLLLHGLNDAQIDEILKTRQLLKTVTIHAPSDEERHTGHGDHPFHVQSLAVQIGQQVAAGDALGVLADHCELYIEGTAFEADAELLRSALQEETPISADILDRTNRDQTISGLKLLYLADQVDRESRALHFYIRLPNEILTDRRENERRFVQWRFTPGQRVELKVPVESWEKRLVVPAESVVGEGAESYVYRQSGNRFERVPVHVEHRDQKSAVIANDGSVFSGEVIASRGAFQIHLALKNRSGPAPDPHAGHGH